MAFFDRASVLKLENIAGGL